MLTRKSPLRPAFTLVELLVTITIISMLAGMMLGALHAARNAAREAATKATIAKLNTIIMRRYESYMTRRVPITIAPGTSPTTAAQMRLGAIRDLMRMEMPDHYTDITNPPNPNATIGGSTIPYTLAEPALHQLYSKKFNARNPSNSNELAKCLYLIVSMGSPEAMEQFGESEIGADTDGWPYFIDGYGTSISFLRWAPGFSSQYVSPLGFHGYSDIQSGDAVNDHDPFDTRNVDTAAFRLVPLIYSSYGLTNASCLYSGGGTTAYTYQGNPYQAFADDDPKYGSGKNLLVGTPTSTSMAGIISNHHIEQR